MQTLSPVSEIAQDVLRLKASDRYPERWTVEGKDSMWFMELEDWVGRYKTVHVSALLEFVAHAESLGYTLEFDEDPAERVLAYEESKSRIPEFSMNSHLPGTTNGFLAHQLEGFNKVISNDRGCLVVWDTGTGKSQLIAALIKQKLEIEDYDLALVVCKSNNKTDTQKKLVKLADIDYSYIFDGAKKKRDALYEEALEELEAGLPCVGILNYEKFKLTGDKSYLSRMVDGRKVLVVLDEMPTRLSNRKTTLYRAFQDVLYGPKKKSRWEDKRPTELFQVATSATPIEKSPVGVLNMMNLIDPDFWPLINEWEATYVSKKDPFTREPVGFRDLDRMKLELESRTSRVDKTDPEIAKLFPVVANEGEEKIEIEMSSYDRGLYTRMGEIAEELLDDPYSEEEVTPLQLISVMQLICCAPSIVSLSASNREAFDALFGEWEAENADVEDKTKAPTGFGSKAAQILVDSLDEEITDAHCEKLATLKDILDTFEDEKVIVFSSLAGYIEPILTKKFEEWGTSYVVFSGTDKRRQAALDQFRMDPSIKIFLSSDKGSDGIDIPEAMVGVNYDLPWKWSTKVQRRNRNNRVDSLLKENYWFDLVYRDSVEERKEQILSRKRGFHEDIFDGGAAQGSIQSGFTRGELLWILRGDPEAEGA